MNVSGCIGEIVVTGISPKLIVGAPVNAGQSRLRRCGVISGAYPCLIRHEERVACFGLSLARGIVLTGAIQFRKEASFPCCALIGQPSHSSYGCRSGLLAFQPIATQWRDLRQAKECQVVQPEAPVSKQVVLPVAQCTAEV